MFWGNLCDKIIEGKLKNAAAPAFTPLCISILASYTENFTTIGWTVFLLWFFEVQKIAKIEGLEVTYGNNFRVTIMKEILFLIEMQ